MQLNDAKYQLINVGADWGRSPISARNSGKMSPIDENVPSVNVYGSFDLDY